MSALLPLLRRAGVLRHISFNAAPTPQSQGLTPSFLIAAPTPQSQGLTLSFLD